MIMALKMPPDNHFFGGDDEGGYVDWSSAKMIGKGGFSIVYCSTDMKLLCRREAATIKCIILCGFLLIFNWNGGYARN